MKRKYTPIAFVSAIALLMCGIGGIIYAIPKTHVVNHLEMGIVDIELEEYQNIQGVETFYDASYAKNVLPLTKISKIPRIRCDGNDSWIRCKIEYLNTEYLGDEDLYGFTKDWVKKSDGYFYYKKVLKTGDTTDLFQGLQLPVDFPQSEEGTRFFLNINAEAVQSQNFTPDFTKREPWGDINVQLCAKEGMYDIVAFKDAKDNRFEITYMGSSDTLIRNTRDFFTNLPFFMPGDTYRDVAEIKNNSKHMIDLYFYTEEISETETDILDRIRLKITYKSNYGEKDVYDGPLRAKNAESPMILAKIQPGEEGNFCYELNIPSELDNQYTLLKDKVKWVFYAEFDESDQTIIDILKTGDDSKLGLYMVIVGISLLAFVLLSTYFKSEEKD